MSASPSTTPTLQQVAFTIRDWLGPFYTLGGVVGFSILVLSLLDPSGRLVLGVLSLLVVAAAAAALAWALLRHRAGPRAQRFFSMNGHWLLCIVALFFACGWLISSWLRSERTPPPSPPAPSPPALSAPAQPAAAAPVPTTSPATPAPAPAMAPAAAASRPSAPAAAAAPTVKAPARQEPVAPTRATATPAAPPTQSPSPAPTATKPAARTDAPAALTAAQQARCARLVQRLSLGETLPGNELNELRSTCGK